MTCTVVYQLCRQCPWFYNGHAGWHRLFWHRVIEHSERSYLWVLLYHSSYDLISPDTLRFIFKLKWMNYGPTIFNFIPLFFLSLLILRIRIYAVIFKWHHGDTLWHLKFVQCLCTVRHTVTRGRTQSRRKKFSHFLSDSLLWGFYEGWAPLITVLTSHDSFPCLN